MAVACLAFAVAILSGCEGSSSSLVSPTVQDISGSELETLLDGPNAPVVVDVRSSTDFESGHIPGSVNIPLSELPERLHEVNDERAIVCVCAGGFRSAQAAQILAAAGVETVYNLEDGLRSYEGPWEPDCPSCG